MIAKNALRDIEDKLLALYTGSNLISEIITCVLTWITRGKVTYSGTTNPIMQQTRIGWNHFLEGRIHLSFQQHMDEHYSKIGSNKTGEMWTAVVIQTLWLKLFEPMWKQRNDTVHCINVKTKTSREVLNLNFTMRELYAKATHLTLLFQDKYLIEDPIQRLLGMTSGSKRGWILSIQTALKESEKAIVAETSSLRNSMRRFRESGSCIQSKNIANTTTATKPPSRISTRRKRIKHHPARKRLPPLLKPSANTSTKKIKRHPLRKKLPPLLSFHTSTKRKSHHIGMVSLTVKKNPNIQFSNPNDLGE